MLCITKHRKGREGYALVSRRITSPFVGDTQYLTEVLIPLPETRVFTQQAIDKISSELSPFVVGQDCLQFNRLSGMDVFWGKDGHLSGAGAVHAFAHLILGMIRQDPRRFLESPEEQIEERIYKVHGISEELLAIVFTGDLHLTEFRVAVTETWNQFSGMISSLGSPQAICACAAS